MNRRADWAISFEVAMVGRGNENGSKGDVEAQSRKMGEGEKQRVG